MKKIAVLISLRLSQVWTELRGVLKLYSQKTNIMAIWGLIIIILCTFLGEYTFSLDINDPDYNYVKDPVTFPLDQLIKDATNLRAYRGDIKKFKKGKVTILFFWTLECFDCKKYSALLAPIFNKYNKRGVRVIGINLNGNSLDKKEIRALIKEYQEMHQISWPQVDVRSIKNKDYYKVLKVPYHPSIIVLDSDNKIRFHASYIELLEESVAFLLEEKSVQGGKN